LMKAMRSELIEPVWMVGVEADSPGLKRAKEMGRKPHPTASTACYRA